MNNFPRFEFFFHSFLLNHPRLSKMEIRMRKLKNKITDIKSCRWIFISSFVGKNQEEFVWVVFFCIILCQCFNGVAYCILSFSFPFVDCSVCWIFAASHIYNLLVRNGSLMRVPNDCFAFLSIINHYKILCRRFAIHC